MKSCGLKNPKLDLYFFMPCIKAFYKQSKIKGSLRIHHILFEGSTKNQFSKSFDEKLINSALILDLKDKLYLASDLCRHKIRI